MIPIKSIFRVIVRNIYFHEIISIKPIQNERSIWSPRRTFFVFICDFLFYATQVKEHIVGPLNLFGHCAVTHRYCFDLNYEISSHPLREVDRFSSHLAIVHTTTRGATPRLVVLVRDDILGSSHLVVMPHLICCAPPPSTGARIGAGIQLWVIGTAVIVCWPAIWWRTSCGNRAISCLKFREMFGNET